MTHADREHAQWSASSTERNWNCPGALALTDGLPEKTSEAADWGTVCHQVAETCLRDGLLDASDFIGRSMKGKKYLFEFDEEMAETTQAFIDYVRERKGSANRVLIEQRFSLAEFDPPFEAGGTADAVVHDGTKRSLEVIDLKTGRGLVEAADNKQLRTYALGALIANRGAPVDTITVTIVQPRAPHKDGRIRSETFHIADLAEWTADLLAAMHRSKAAFDAQSGGLPQAAWAAEHLRPGDHCHFCKAAGFCPSLQQKAYDAAGVWFDDLDQPRISTSNAPDAMSPAAIAQALDAAEMISTWINAVRGFAHAQAEGGVAIPGYTLVEAVGRRKWKDESAALAALQAKGVDPYQQKLVSPAQAEKRLGAKRKKEIDSLIETPITGTNLVRADKTSRSPAKPAVEKFFDQLD